MEDMESWTEFSDDSPMILRFGCDLYALTEDDWIHEITCKAAVTTIQVTEESTLEVQIQELNKQIMTLTTYITQKNLQDERKWDPFKQQNI